MIYKNIQKLLKYGSQKRKKRSIPLTSYDELSKEKQQKKFKKFVKKWNKRELNDIFYNERELLSKYGDEINQGWNFLEDEKEHSKLQLQLKKNQMCQESKMPFNRPYNNDKQVHQGPKLPDPVDKQKEEYQKAMAKHNLMTMHEVDANNTYKWGNFDGKREDKRAMRKFQEQQNYTQKQREYQLKENDKLKNILETVNLQKKFM